MKRFLYDAILLIILVLIGVSIADEETISTQQKLDSFQQEIKKEEKIEMVEKKASLNQIDDNGASSFANSASDVVKEVTGVGVSIVHELFELIVK